MSNAERQKRYRDRKRDGAVLVVSRPHPFKNLTLPVVAAEGGIPEPEGVDPGWGDRPAGDGHNGKGK